MNRTERKSRLAGFSAGAGEWMHYAAAVWLASRAGGLTLVAVYLVAVTVPGAFIRLPVKRQLLGSLLSAAALMSLVGFRPMPAAGFVVAGLAVGIGHALAGRPAAWSSGLNSFHGYAGVAGAVGGVVSAEAGGGEWGLVAASVLIMLGALSPSLPDLVGPLPRGLYPAAAAVGFCVGMRVVEPGPFEGPVASAVFVSAWAVGLNVAASSARSPDARLVVGAPFVAAAALAGLGAVTGPAWVFLYAILAACVGFVGRAGGTSRSATESRVSLWPAGRGVALGGAVLGAAWASQISGLEAITAGAAAAALAGGFLSLGLVRRADVADKAEVADAEVVGWGAAEAEASAGTFDVEPSAVEDVAAVVNALRSALAEARTIRAEAIATATAPHESALPTREVAQVLDDLLVSAERAAAAVKDYLPKNVTSAIPTE